MGTSQHDMWGLVLVCCTSGVWAAGRGGRNGGGLERRQMVGSGWSLWERSGGSGWVLLGRWLDYLISRQQSVRQRLGEGRPSGFRLLTGSTAHQLGSVTW